jgi:hypothetical protein
MVIRPHGRQGLFYAAMKTTPFLSCEFHCQKGALVPRKTEIIPKVSNGVAVPCIFQPSFSKLAWIDKVFIMAFSQDAFCARTSFSEN